MTIVVVDASVAVLWFLPNVLWQAARRVLAPQYARLAPELIWSEIGNALWKRWRRGDISAAASFEALRDLASTDLDIEPTVSLTMRALEIAQATDRTVYDCLYLALAEAKGCRLVTADRRFYNALQSTPYAGTVLWVEDVP
jgi:predicted nucleic acid-binding protein